MKKCPYCLEQIQDEAVVCRYCGQRCEGAPQPPAQLPQKPPAPPARKPNKTAFLVVLGVCALVLLSFVLSTLLSGPGGRQNPSDHAGVTLEEYARIQPGMSSQQVGAVVDAASDINIRLPMQSVVRVSVSLWQNGNFSGMLCVFEEDRLTIRSQFRLK